MRGKSLKAVVYIVTTVFALTACTGAATDASVSSQKSDVMKQSVFPDGMYGLDGAVATRSGPRVDFHAPAPCDQVLEIIEAGQWSAKTVVPRVSPLTESIVELARGGVRALAQFYFSDESCDATITEPESQPIALSGAEQATGTAQFLPFGCQNQGDDTNTISFAGLYDGPGDVHVMVQASFTGGVKGEQEVVADDNVEVSVRHGAESILTTLGQVMAISIENPGSVDPEDDTVAQQLELLGEGYHPGGDFSGGVTITTVKPLTGTLTLGGLLDDTESKHLTITVGFVCN